MKIIHIVGARPNFMKIAPIIEEIGKREGLTQIQIHTGQHYDKALSKVFFEELELPKPDIDLEIGSSTHAVQTGRIMINLEPLLMDQSPDWILVVGDVNSTLAATLTASKLGLRVVHVEAGLRSFDRSMPEEINRIVTDSLADLLLTTERSADENLMREGIAREKINFVGNVMIDTLHKFREKASQSSVLARLGITKRTFGLLTLHRPASVDDPIRLRGLLETLEKVSCQLPIIFPCHPRTKKRLEAMSSCPGFLQSLSDGNTGIVCIEPLGYLDFLNLMAHATCVLTDSGGIQEETTILGVPCLTLRENTERPITVWEGTNTLVGYDPDRIFKETHLILQGEGKKGRIPELWDGKAAIRIVDALIQA